MENNSVIVRNDRKISSMVLFWVCVLATVGVGLTVAYCSGILGGINHLANIPLAIPRWLVIAIPPVLFVHMGLALFFELNENIYTQNGRAVRTCMWIFWTMLFIATAILPYFIVNNMAVAAYIVSTIATAFAIGTTILMYNHTIAGGVVMTIFLVAISLIMVYLGYWAF